MLTINDNVNKDYVIKKIPTKKSTKKNSSVIYFNIFIISASDFDLEVRTMLKNWFFYTKMKCFF